MARPSKTNRFRVHEDADTTRSDNGKGIRSPHKETTRSICTSPRKEAGSSPGPRTIETERHYDDERRESHLTRTSISSFPSSLSEYEGGRKTDSIIPQAVRPAFNRQEWMQRTHATAGPPLDLATPSHSRQQSLATRSDHSEHWSGSRRPRSRASKCSEESESGESEGVRDIYPLVLLHITLLPVSLPWSIALMQEELSEQTMKNLHLLRSKISDTIVQRGILIPHPREEYELLEERLLQALELEPERITKCGHFRSRLSVDTAVTLSPRRTSEDSNGDVDSALGSSCSDSDMCNTCRYQPKLYASKAGTGSRRWSVKVFAANGLMRASAWTAAWSEMERVDVEILPWIDEDDRRRLDQRLEIEEAETRIAEQEEEGIRIHQLIEEQANLIFEERSRMAMLQIEPKAPNCDEYTLMSQEIAALPSAPESNVTAASKPTHRDLPPIYHTSQIPLSILLKNYLYLLGQDKRNVALLFAVIIAIFALFQAASTMNSASLLRMQLQALATELNPVVGSEALFQTNGGTNTTSALVGANLDVAPVLESENLIETATLASGNSEPEIFVAIDIPKDDAAPASEGPHVDASVQIEQLEEPEAVASDGPAEVETQMSENSEKDGTLASLGANDVFATTSSDSSSIITTQKVIQIHVAYQAVMKCICPVDEYTRSANPLSAIALCLL